MTLECSKIWERIGNQVFFNEIESIIGKKRIKELLDIVNFGNPSIVEHDERRYYILHDFEDGNYLGVNENGEIYGLIHDPFSVEFLFPDSNMFIEAILNKTFNLELYYANKLKS